jgi:hypothetical protein
MDATESRCLLLHMEWADSLAWNAALGVPALAQDERLLTSASASCSSPCTRRTTADR